MKQSSGLSPVVPFVPFGCSSRPAKRRDSVPQPLHSTKKHSSPAKGRTAMFFRCSFLIFTRSLPAFGRAYAATIPLHSVSIIRSLNAPFHSAESSLFLFTTFQPYSVCRPPCFQRWLLRTAIRVGTASLFCNINYSQL